jgi:hypothetical protein
MSIDTASVDWLPKACNDLFTNLVGTNGFPSFTDVSAAKQGTRFYRVVIP